MVASTLQGTRETMMNDTFDSRNIRESMLSRQVSRRTLLKRSIVAGAGAMALTTVGGASSIGQKYFSFAVQQAEAAQLNTDIDVLNYALTLEYLESDAYMAINDAGILSGRAATYFQAFGGHEQEHVAAIMATIEQLGGTPVEKPAFDFSGVPSDPMEVVAFFQTVEAVGASAYLGAAPSIENHDVLTAALQIHANEAEHAAALADLVAPGTDLFSPDAFGMSRTPAQVLEIIAPWLPSGAGGGMPDLPATGSGGTATRVPFGGGLRSTLK